MSISLVELLDEIGVENVGVQYLTRELDGDQKLVGRGGKLLRVSFLTSPDNLDLSDLLRDRPPKREAIICWVDRARMDEAMAKLKQRKGLK